jgi:glycosyltransferase involved in cell wall biosynthesis
MKIVVIMPAYNAEKTLKKTYLDIPKGLVDEIILVDDASIDNTVKIAKELGIKVFEHTKNKGYGGNQKTCYKEALKIGADIIVMIHPDYQYDSRLLPKLVEPILEGNADVVIGSRIRTRKEALESGMPVYKYLGNRFLTLIENIVLGQNLSEFHSGFRAYTRKFLNTVPFELNSNDFVFDTEILVQAVMFNFRIAEIPVPTRYFPEASSINFKRSVVYGTATLWTLVKYILHKMGLIKCKIFNPKI